ncbi:MAG: hypothetical protein DHS20C15_22590 [Planctomycetota bacterium]|nr:MAG: hypothetical protein DHS20C15_22590 [Planctomycetota bacterium]
MDRSAFKQFALLEQRHWWFRGRRALYLPLLEHVLQARLGRAPRDLRVVDAGCGTGGFLEPLARFGTVSGFELDEPAIEWCRERGFASSFVARSDQLPLRPQSVDLLTLFDVLEHTPDDRAVLTELVPALKPGGHLALSVPAYQWLFSNNDRVAHHYRRYTRRELVGKLRHAGLRVVKATYVNVTLSPLIVPAVLAMKFKQRLSPQSDDPTTNLSYTPPRPINALLGGVFAGERHLLRHVSAPFGHSLFVIAERPA